MKKLTIIIIFPFLFFSCQNINKTEKLEAEIQELKTQNDSLENIVNRIKEKYVFDNITVRTIPSYKNTDKLNSIHKQEIVFIGYNDDGRSRVMFNANQEKGVGRQDTLKIEKGAFILERKLTEEKNYFNGWAETSSEYGKVFGTPIGIGIWAQQN